MKKLTKKQAVIYKQRWQQVESIQIQELRTTPVFLKFKQLCFLMNSFPFTQKDKRRDKDVKAIRQRWVTLKER